MVTSDLEIVKRMAPDIACFIDCFEVRTYLNPAHFFMLLRAGDLWRPETASSFWKDLKASLRLTAPTSLLVFLTPC